jgi:hypothetical protein
MKQVIQAQLAQKNIKAESIELTHNGIEINFSTESEQIARSIGCYTISGHIVSKRFSEVSQFIGEAPYLPKFPTKRKQSFYSKLLAVVTAPFAKLQPTF